MLFETFNCLIVLVTLGLGSFDTLMLLFLAGTNFSGFGRLRDLVGIDFSKFEMLIKNDVITNKCCNDCGMIIIQTLWYWRTRCAHSPYIPQHTKL